MADYSIYVLDEQDMTIVGGQLDGQNQGNGSHLVGAQITLNNNNFNAIQITDNNANFQDGGSQFLDGAQSIDGINYASGTKVEAEYELTLTDGTNFYTVIGFNVNNSNPAFGTVEGLAFIGEFPPVGVPLTVTANKEGPNYVNTDYAVPCFTAGTRIQCDTGERLIETLKPGDLVQTADSGFQPLMWIGQRRVAAIDRLAPIQFRAGALEENQELLVSPNHRMLVSGWRAEMAFGATEILVAAKDLVNDDTVRPKSGGWVTYVHLLFEKHEIVKTHGVWSESFFPAQSGMNALDKQVQAEVFEIFPELNCAGDIYGQTARPCIKPFEARVLQA